MARPLVTVNMASWNVLPVGALAFAKTGKATSGLAALKEVEM